MPKLFVAVWPPHDVVDALAGLPRPAAPGVRWTRRERLHITLRYLGECDLEEALATLRGQEFPTATVTLGPEPERLGRGVLMLRAEGLEDLGDAVLEATRYIGEEPPDRPYFGHMTVARYRQRPPAPQWPRQAETFEADEISLVESAPWGEYLEAERFTLAAPTASPPSL